jgi:hypothetical protein
MIPGIIASGQASSGGGTPYTLKLGAFFLKLGADQLVLGA